MSRGPAGQRAEGRETPPSPSPQHSWLSAPFWSLPPSPFTRCPVLGGTVMTPFNLIKLLRINDSGEYTKAFREQTAAKNKGVGAPSPGGRPGSAGGGGRGLGLGEGLGGGGRVSVSGEGWGGGVWGGVLQPQPGREEAGSPSPPLPPFTELGPQFSMRRCGGWHRGSAAVRAVFQTKNIYNKGPAAGRGGFVRIQRWERFI